MDGAADVEPADDNRAALAAWWCDSYRRHRAAADRFGWRDVLDAAMADFDAGLDVAEVLRRHHLPAPAAGTADAARGDLVDLTGLGVEALPVDGDYHCPRARPCGRRSRAHPDTGTEPRCDIADRVMRYQPGPRP